MTKEFNQPIGAHMSISGGLYRAFERGEAVGCTAMQIFTKNASQWRGKPISDEDARLFREAWEQSVIGPVIAHDTYLINLAATDDEKWAKSKAAFADEIERCSKLGIPGLVMHPGSHLEAGEETGLAKVCTAFKEIFAETPDDVTVLIENTAGQGTNLGWRFEHLAAIIEGVPEGRFGVCFDTCHAFAAGYDISTMEGFAKVMAEFDRLVGVEMIKAFHVNDAKKPLASRVDRHDQIGEGMIGREGFRALMQDARFHDVPKILETPKGEDDIWDKKNLALLRELAG
ncbi:MAG: deoxyribonuclease IV [Desulfuromonas sp.]|nr:MAG: deoxyribonuclease IV [Desulfuromonas sp.]